MKKLKDHGFSEEDIVWIIKQGKYSSDECIKLNKECGFSACEIWYRFGKSGLSVEEIINLHKEHGFNSEYIGFYAHVRHKYALEEYKKLREEGFSGNGIVLLAETPYAVQECIDLKKNHGLSAVDLRRFNAQGKTLEEILMAQRKISRRKYDDTFYTSRN